MQKPSRVKQGSPWMRLLGVIVGLVAFALPFIVLVTEVHLSHSNGIDQRTAALFPIYWWGSIVLAALVPTALIMTSRLSWFQRIGLTIAMLCLLAIEVVFTAYLGVLAAGA